MRIENERGPFTRRSSAWCEACGVPPFQVHETDCPEADDA